MDSNRCFGRPDRWGVGDGRALDCPEAVVEIKTEVLLVFLVVTLRDVVCLVLCRRLAVLTPESLLKRTVFGRPWSINARNKQQEREASESEIWQDQIGLKRGGEEKGKMGKMGKGTCKGSALRRCRAKWVGTGCCPGGSRLMDVRLRLVCFKVRCLKNKTCEIGIYCTNFARPLRALACTGLNWTSTFLCLSSPCPVYRSHLLP